MAKNKMLKVLKDSFKDFKFFEDGHYYTYKDKPVGISVTRFIAEYEKDFPSLMCEIKPEKLEYTIGYKDTLSLISITKTLSIKGIL